MAVKKKLLKKTNRQNVINREDWLTRAATIASEELFRPQGYEVPNKIKYSCSFPAKGRGSKNRTIIGQCWSRVCSEDGSIEIFVSPELSDNRQVFATLVHELVHAVVGNENGHNKVFKQCALKVGLQGKMTATTMSDETYSYLEELLTTQLGDYPHAKMINLDGGKKQTTRMKKYVCKCCGHFIRSSRGKFEEVIDKRVELGKEPHYPCAVCDTPLTMDE